MGLLDLPNHARIHVCSTPLALRDELPKSVSGH
jgi:hypothetical protein